jgi:hypothetical protein
LAIWYLDLLSSISGEYLFGGLPRLCLKGKLYPAEVSMSFIKEGVPILLTSRIFLGDGPAGTKGQGDSSSSPVDVGSSPVDVGLVYGGLLDSEDISCLEDVFVDSSPIICVSFRSSNHSNASHFNSSSNVSP